MIHDPDLRCVYCQHEHRGIACPPPCGCYWFVSESAWRAEGERREVPGPTSGDDLDDALDMLDEVREARGPEE